MSAGVYVFRDSAEEVIYVGFTEHRADRMRNHERWKSWWPEVASIEWLPMPSAEDALLLESRMIADLRPRFNGTKLAPQQVPSDALSDDERSTLRGLLSSGRRGELVAFVRSLNATGLSDAAIAHAAGRAASWATDIRARRRYAA